MKDGLLLEKSPDEEVVAFIQKYVRCEILNKNVLSTFYETVISYQNHKHNSYCMRMKKTNIYRKYQFDFPRPVTNNFVLRDVTSIVVGIVIDREVEKLYAKLN